MTSGIVEPFSTNTNHPSSREGIDGEGGSDTAAVEIDDAPALATGEDHAPVKGIAALRIEQAKTPQQIERIALSGEMSAQAPAGA